MIDCVVTIHGIGSQTEGYADALHEHLRATLGPALYVNPVYVAGHWPPHDDELGRLGRWDSAGHRSIDATNAPLGADGTIVHVPLVYSDTQGRGDHPLVALEVTVQALLALKHLSVLADAARMGEDLIQAALRDVGGAASSALHGLERAAGSAVQAVESHVEATSQRVPAADNAPAAGTVNAVQTTGSVTASVQPTPLQTALLARLDPQHALGPLENDVAMYVVRNDHRERVRSFVHDAILRLCFRADVRSVVVNTHSNGTVIGSDVLRQLPPAASAKIKAFVTSGSPLRKYDDCFAWGTEFFLTEGSDGPIPQVEHWTNFWDPRDPVADSLDGLFRAYDPQSGTVQLVPVADIAVDNLTNSSGGGLQAHNYWDNVKQWVPAFVRILQT